MKWLITIITICIFTLHAQAQPSGCPDPAALNYNPSVTSNDGSCTYTNTSLKPDLIYTLQATLNETSGLIFWKKKLWTHNDSGGEAALYQLNARSGVIENKFTIANATNTDWEDIAQDNRFIYIGDFGNNANGNRTDLKIYKLTKADLLAGTTVSAQVINFYYSDQDDFTPKGSNNTDFDCEALISLGDSLYLFSKNWINKKTKLYALAKTPGTHIAEKRNELEVNGLITGAEIIPDQRVVVLSGYSTALAPFIYLLYDFSGSNFFGANKRKVNLSQSFTQVEGICAQSPVKLLISNEKYQQLLINTPAKLQRLSVDSLLIPYYETLQKNSGAKQVPVFSSTAGHHLNKALQ